MLILCLFSCHLNTQVVLFSLQKNIVPDTLRFEWLIWGDAHHVPSAINHCKYSGKLFVAQGTFNNIQV